MLGFEMWKKSGYLYFLLWIGLCECSVRQRYVRGDQDNANNLYFLRREIRPPSHYRVLDVFRGEPRSHFPRQNDDPECEVVDPPPPPVPTPNITLWDLLEDGKNQLELSDKYTDVVLLMGNTGSGKSTLTHLTVGNATGLRLVMNPSGNYLIVDDNDKIGHTTASRTLVPELVVDKDTSLAIYDCPGFDDNRGPDTDITANFLLKAVTDHVSSISIGFVVIHSSVSGTNDKTDFDRMTTHAVNLVKDLTHYEPGIGLIVSKAPNFNPNNGKPIPDEEILSGIVSFLKMYKSDQEGKLNDLRVDRNLIRRKIAFVDILLQEGRIGFMRLAARCGRLSDDPVAMATRATLQKLLSKNLTLVQSQPNDFGWALTGNTLLKVNDYVEQINKNISSLGNTLFPKVRRIQGERMTTISTFNETRHFIHAEFAQFSTALKLIDQNATISSSPKLLAQEIRRVLLDRGYDSQLGNDYYNALHQLDEYLDFFEDMAKNPIHRDVQSWLKPMRTFVDDETGKRNEWYDFLDSLQTKLGEYSFQNEKPNILVPTQPNMDWIHDSLGIPVSSRIREIFSTKDLLTQEDTDLMKVIIDIAMERSSVDCVGQDTLIVRGGYVLASEFTTSAGNYVKCSDPKDVQIFATQVLFMNRKIQPNSSQKNHQLSIIAPFTEITTTDQLSINLDGRDGASGEKATDNTNGDVGLPGENGGSFFFITGALFKGNNFKISASGGNGGHGYRGIDGKQGDQGNPTVFDLWPAACTWLGGFFDKVVNTGIYKFHVTKFGGPGGEGFPGGNGGVSGQGGFSGRAEVLQIDKLYPKVEIAKEIKNGTTGTDGAGGVGGAGGNTGNGLEADMTTNIDCIWNGYSNHKSVPGSQFHDRDGSPGKNGSTGGNKIGQKFPTQPSFSLIRSKLVNDYKAYVYSTEKSQFPNNFLQVLEENEEIQELYNPVAFCQELLDLEYYSLSVRDQMDNQPVLLSRYLKYLTRLETFSSLHESNLNNSDKKVLAILYTTALSKITSLTNQLGSTIVINVGNYLKSVLKRFDRYQETQTQVVIDEQRKSYAAGYEGKIEQSLYFIEEVVTPGITQVEMELQSTADDLLRQIIKMQTAIENEEFERKQALEKMNEQMAFRHLFSALRITATFTSFLGAQGAAIGGLMGSLTNVGEQWALGDYTGSRPPINLPPAIKGHADRVEKEAMEESKEKLEELVEIILATEKGIQQNPAVLNDLSDPLKKLDDLVKELKENKDHYDIQVYVDKTEQLTQAEKTLLNSLDKKETSLNGVISSPSSTPKEKDDAKKGIESVTVIKNTATVINLGLDIYKKYQNDAKEMERLAQMVREAEKAVEDVKAYKESVYSSLMPMVANIAEELRNVTESLGKESSVSLLVTKWEVQRNLNDVKFFLRQFTEGLPHQERFSQLVDKLAEAMTLLIELYDYIETYNEHMAFADYLANINSPSAKGIIINDPEAVRLINKIELALQSNILLKEYDRAVDTFKQWIFPFAHLYMDDFTLPGNMSDFLLPSSTMNNTDDLMFFQIPVLKGRIVNLDQRMDDYKSMSFGEIDAKLIKSEFNSSFQSSHPFFVWENRRDLEIIRTLFSGGKVSVRANPTYSSSRWKSAVKFRVAEVVPKTLNDEGKDELEKVLKGFTMIMTHSGVSHYVYGDEGYSMVGDNATLRYNFERDTAGNRLGTNMVYEKVKEGDFIMSPYTLWTLQLIKANENGVGFAALEEWVDQVDLELVGVGTFVDERVHFRDRKGNGMQVYRYYQEDRDNF
ncbi:Macrophage receptor MARCO [Folsomia candida]|uniref:Macrophage receptor MARCO n=2 Tax=Folsomia candida TaxID=158441 RepID=A0A226EQ22_FOLCA|nr:Macrophage receptor MARCO [Folsomia candida]